MLLLRTKMMCDDFLLIICILRFEYQTASGFKLFLKMLAGMEY